MMMIDDLAKFFDKEEVATVFDFSKASHCVNHRKLRQKVLNSGFSSQIIECIDHLVFK